MTNPPKMAPEAPANEPVQKPVDEKTEPKVEATPVKPNGSAEPKKI